MLSNVQIIPPRSIGYSERKYEGMDRDLTEELNIEGSTGVTGSDDNRNWKRMDMRKKKGPRRIGQNKSEYRDHHTPSRNAQLADQGSNAMAQNSIKKSVTSRKPPKTAAVMIVGNSEDFSYADALKRARAKISLDELRIERTKIRRAANSGMLIEVMGPEGTDKANVLAEQLRVVLQDNARVTRPVAREEVRTRRSR